MSENKELPSSLAELLAQLERDGIPDHQRYPAIRSYLNFRAREEGVPISGMFELTPLCNLDCKMCYVHLNKPQMHGAELLPAPVWIDLIRQAADAGMMYAKLTGGECLTYPGFREIYLYLHELGIETEILSNGILMDQDMAAFFQEHPPSAIQITLYGASEEAYERVTGHRAFSIVMENIERLRKYGLPLSVAVTPNAFMTDGEEIVRLVRRMGLTPRINSGLMAPREQTGRKKEDAALDVYIEMLKLNDALGGGKDLTPCDEASLPEPGGAGSVQTYGVHCGAGRSGFSIAWNGIMRPCNTFPDIGENALELGFSEAWKRINARANRFPQPIECTSCEYEGICPRCVAEHASDVPVGHASPSICARTRRLVAEGFFKQ